MSTPVVNPYLAAAKYSITHFDSAQTDNFPYAVLPGTTNVSPLALPQVIGGPINIMTYASTSADYMWGVSTTGVSYIRVAGNAFTPLHRLALPGAPSILTTLLVSILNQPFTTVQQIQAALQSLGLGGGSGFGLLGGIYSVVDNNNELYVNYQNYIHAIGLVSLLGLQNIGVKRSLNAATFLQSGETIAGLSMTYDGHLVVVGGRSVSIVNRDFTTPVRTVTFPVGETISNSVAVDENNGIYVITDKNMYKIVWTGTVLSQNAADGAWSSAYPTGDTYPTIFGSGSGSTPTLMGFGDDADKLVVITDGLKKMSLIAFWRNEIPTGFTNRTAGQIQITCGLPASTEYIQTDQSVAIKNYGAFVVNNISTDTLTGVILVDALARGPVLAAPIGVERCEWNPLTHSWSSIWTRADVSSISTVPTVSVASDMVFVNGYYSGSGWEATGLDWLTGLTVHRTIFGVGVLGNGFYGLIQFLPDGDLLFNSLIGPTRVQLPGGAVNLL